MNLDFNRRPLQHGELVLRPVINGSVPEGKIIKTNRQVVAHSESGAHHVLEARTDFEVTTVRNADGTETMYLSMPTEGQLVHNKTGPDTHATLPVVAGSYVVMEKKEWDPFAEVVRVVAD